MTAHPESEEQVMDAESKRIIEQNTAYVGEILEDIYRRLSGPVTEEKLAEILKRYFPSESDERLIQSCGWLRRGIQNGEETFDEFEELSEEEQEAEILKNLEACLSGMPEEEQHQRLVLFYQILCHQYHQTVDENLAVYLAGLSTDRLKQDVSFLLKQESTCTVNEMLSAVTAEEEKITIPESASQYSDDENAWIMSAAIYASARQKGHKTAEPMKIGEQVGFARRFFTKLGEAARTKLLPIGLGLLAAAAAGMTVHMLIGFLGSSQLAASAFAVATHLNPYAVKWIPLLVPAAYIYASVGAGYCVYETTLQMLNRPKAEAAETTLEAHFRTIQNLADSMVTDFSQAESEDEQDLLEEDDVHEEGVSTVLANG